MTNVVESQGRRHTFQSYSLENNNRTLHHQGQKDVEVVSGMDYHFWENSLIFSTYVYHYDIVNCPLLILTSQDISKSTFLTKIHSKFLDFCVVFVWSCSVMIRNQSRSLRSNLGSFQFKIFNCLFSCHHLCLSRAGLAGAGIKILKDLYPPPEPMLEIA